MNRHNSQSIVHCFAIRDLLWLIALCAIVAAIWSVIRQAARYSPYETYDKWPRALLAMIGDNANLRQEVEPYGYEGIWHHHSVWRIKAGSQLRDVLFAKNDLQRTDICHPKVLELRRSVPAAWDKFSWDRCIWHATPGYG